MLLGSSGYGVTSGIDYLSIAAYINLVPAHQVLLKKVLVSVLLKPPPCHLSLTMILAWWPYQVDLEHSVLFWFLGFFPHLLESFISPPVQCAGISQKDDSMLEISCLSLSLDFGTEKTYHLILDLFFFSFVKSHGSLPRSFLFNHS
jgi:hypothetical protein